MSETKLPSKAIALPLVPDNLKGRKAVFGYLFDDAVQRNYYDKLELASVVTQEDYLNINEKDSIVGGASQMTRCGAGIIRLPSRITGPGKMAVFACFGYYNPPYYSNGLPSVDVFTKFKELLYLDTDPEWFAI